MIAFSSPTKAIAAPPIVFPPVAAGVPTLGQSEAPQDQQARAMVDPHYKVCGQTCLHEKAAEVLTQEIEVKTNILKEVQSDNSGWKDLIPGYCGKTETDDICQKRYENEAAFWFVKARAALAKNDLEMARLTCKIWAPDGTCTERVDSKVAVYGQDFLAADQKKSEQVEYYTKAQDLLAIHEAKLKAFQSSKINADENKMQEEYINQFEPKPEDFITFTSVPVDPDNLSAGSWKVPVYDGDKLKLDKAAFKKAHDLFLGAKPAMKDSFAGKDLKDLAKTAEDQFQKEFKDKSDTGTTHKLRRLYNQTRGQLQDSYKKFTDDARADLAKDLKNGTDDSKKNNAVTEKKSNTAKTSGKPASPPTGTSKSSTPAKEYTGNEDLELEAADLKNTSLGTRQVIQGTQIGIKTDPQPAIAGSTATPTAAQATIRPPTDTSADESKGPSETQTLFDLYF